MGGNTEEGTMAEEEGRGVLFLPSAQPQFLCNQAHHWVCLHSSPPLISLHSNHVGASQTTAWRKLRRTGLMIEIGSSRRNEQRTGDVWRKPMYCCSSLYLRVTVCDASLFNVGDLLGTDWSSDVLIWQRIISYKFNSSVWLWSCSKSLINSFSSFSNDTSFSWSFKF